MKTLRIMLALSLCGAVSTSHALVGRFSKPLIAGFASSARANVLRSKLLLGSGLVGTGLFSSYAYQQRASQENAFKKNGTVTIKNIVGNVNVEGWDQERLHVETCKEASTQEAINDIESTTKISDSDQTAGITAVYKGTYTFENSPAMLITNSKVYFGNPNFTITMDNNGNINGIDKLKEAPLMHYTVKVPHSSHVVVRNRMGDVTLKNINGSVNAQTQSGDIETSDCANVKAKSISGALRLYNAYNSVKAKTVSGAITIIGKKQSLQKAKASTVSGDVWIDGAETAYGKSVTGNVEIRGASKGRAKSIRGTAIFYGE